MSEKAMWKWLCQRMKGTSWRGRRIEKCSIKGFPDTIQKNSKNELEFMELKDWSGAKRHPLTVEQFNFLDEFGGWVMVKTDSRTLYLMHSWSHDLKPLMDADKDHVLKWGRKLDISSFNPEHYLEIL